MNADDQAINPVPDPAHRNPSTPQASETPMNNPLFNDPMSSFVDRAHSKDQSIRDRQKYRTPTADQQRLFATAHLAHMQVIEAMLLLPDGRERATAITVLENNRMVMNRAIALASPEDVTSALALADQQYDLIGEIRSEVEEAWALLEPWLHPNNKLQVEIPIPNRLLSLERSQQALTFYQQQGWCLAAEYHVRPLVDEGEIVLDPLQQDITILRLVIKPWHETAPFVRSVRLGAKPRGERIFS